MNLQEIHKTFAESEYGQKLEANVRFGDFKPDYIDNSLWEMLLGDDVNNLRHMPHTLEITRQFIRHEKIGGMLLRLTAISHDWGEAVVGDIALPDKEGQSTADEEKAYLDIAYELLGQDAHILSEVPKVLWGEPGLHRLTEPFNAIEYIGYCQTGVRAGNVAEMIANGVLKINLPRQHIDGLVGGLLSLNKMVGIKNYPKLAKYTERYRSIPLIMGY